MNKIFVIFKRDVRQVDLLPASPIGYKHIVFKAGRKYLVAFYSIERDEISVYTENLQDAWFVSKRFVLKFACVPQ